MVILIVESWYPPDKASDAGKKWLEVTQKFPPDRKIEKRLMVAVESTEDGIHTIGAWDIKEGKEKEALLRMSNAMLMFTTIEGYRYSIKTYLSAVEAMGIIGLKAPEDVPEKAPEIY